MFLSFCRTGGVVRLLGSSYPTCYRNNDRKREHRQTGKELQDYKWGKTDGLAAETESEVSEGQAEQEHRLMLWDSSVLTGRRLAANEGERNLTVCVRGVRVQQRWGFEWNNMGPWGGKADSDGIRGEKEVLENMKEILRPCRWPRHVFTTRWISTQKPHWQMGSPDVPHAFRHLKGALHPQSDHM